MEKKRNDKERRKAGKKITLICSRDWFIKSIAH